jgi:hypothetical protein
MTVPALLTPSLTTVLTTASLRDAALPHVGQLHYPRPSRILRMHSEIRAQQENAWAGQGIAWFVALILSLTRK